MMMSVEAKSRLVTTHHWLLVLGENQNKIHRLSNSLLMYLTQ